MKITGIICEYNPMHNGHVHHLKRTRDNGATHIAAVMSGSFVQRGETAVMNKHLRASIALKGGADLIIELPAVYSLASAEFYARGAVSILDSLGCVDEISFGSECGNIDILLKAADAVMSISKEEAECRMKGGITYPAAVTSLIAEKYGSEIGDVIASPNNILAVEYIKALDRFKSKIKPFTIRRFGSEHDSDNTSESIASASYIRGAMTQKKDFERFIPDYINCEYQKCLLDGKLSDMKNLERIILYKLRTSPLSELKNLPDVGQGLEYRLKQASDSGTVGELLTRLKTKRYTMARLKRIIVNMIIGTVGEDLKILPPYGHILAMNERGREILSCCKNSKIPLSTSLSKLSKIGNNAERFAFLEGNASDIYGLSQNNPGSKNDDFRAAVRIEKNEN